MVDGRNKRVTYPITINKEVDVMRTLEINELQRVAGGTGQCSADEAGSGNNYGGVTQPSRLAQDLIDIYEGLVAATSHVIERVAGAL